MAMAMRRAGPRGRKYFTVPRLGIVGKLRFLFPPWMGASGAPSGSLSFDANFPPFMKGQQSYINVRCL